MIADSISGSIQQRREDAAKEREDAQKERKRAAYAAAIYHRHAHGLPNAPHQPRRNERRFRRNQLLISPPFSRPKCENVFVFGTGKTVRFAVR